MSHSSAVSARQHTPRASYPNATRSALVAVGTLGLLLFPTHTAAAQTLTPAAKQWEFRVSSGAFVPAGKQRNVLKDAHVTAAQLTWLVRPSLAITGTFGWARSRDLTVIDTPKLDVFTSDLGVEVRSAAWHEGRTVSFSPFVGLGTGARSYNYRTLDVDATNNLAGYASVGGELGIDRVGVRLEARDYATGFKPLITAGTADTRNDVVIMAAFRFNRHTSRN